MCGEAFVVAAFLEECVRLTIDNERAVKNGSKPCRRRQSVNPVEELFEQFGAHSESPVPIRYTGIRQEKITADCKYANGATLARRESASATSLSPHEPLNRCHTEFYNLR